MKQTDKTGKGCTLDAATTAWLAGVALGGEGQQTNAPTVGARIAGNAYRNIAEIRKDGYRVYQLKFRGSNLEIVPELGSNAIRMTQKVGDREYEVLETPTDLKRLASMKEPVRSFLFGTPVLFPWSNLWPEEIEVAGKKHKMPKQDVFIENGLLNHGLASKRPWTVIDAGETDDGTWIQTEFDIDNPDFPAEWRDTFGGLKLAIRYTLKEDELGMDVEYANRSQETRLTSFGFHPIFRVHGDWRKIQYNIAARKRVVMDERRRPLRLEDPTGDHLLSDWREINWKAYSQAGASVNSFYTDLIRDPEGRAEISARFPESGLRLRLRMDSSFKHTAFLLIYKRPGNADDKWLDDFWPGRESVLSFEPYTSSVFAAEAAAQGLPWADAVFLKPGARFKGTVSFGLSAEPAAAGRP